MATCRGCGTTHDPEALIRHDHERLVIVHCPACNAVLGRYRQHGQGGR